MLFLISPSIPMYPGHPASLYISPLLNLLGARNTSHILGIECTCISAQWAAHVSVSLQRDARVKCGAPFVDLSISPLQVTITTIGYGDFHPITLSCQIIVIFVIALGVVRLIYFVRKGCICVWFNPPINNGICYSREVMTVLKSAGTKVSLSLICK